MEILQYTSDQQTPVTQFYNRLIANVPHCYPVAEEEFAIVLRGVTTGKADKDDFGRGLDSETAFVAMTEGAVQAFIHVGLTQMRDEDVGIIRFLGYERGARRAGQAALEKAETYLKAFNVTRIFAAERRYRFYHFEYACLSDALDQVQGLLGFNGYRRSNGWVFLDWENYDVTPIPAPIPVTLSVEWKDERGQRPDSVIKAYQGDEEIGLCVSVSGGEYSDHPDAQDWFHTVYLEIEGEFQGQGLGRYLLQYALQEMKKIGYQHATISTRWDDYRALLFYSNCGYRVADWTYAYEKVLSEPPTPN
ncbi:MAG: GNAT family N-acetyltransferase [Candidatus Poribacteria bacterium]|nr:GNAT family N-acetyltransferase [Candidatus Poribacteria bacterium]